MCAVYLCFAQAKYVHMNMASQSSVCLCSSFSSGILSSKQNTIGSRIIPNMLQHSEMRTNLQQQCQQQTQIKNTYKYTCNPPQQTLGHHFAWLGKQS